MDDTTGMSMMDVEQLARHRGNEWVEHYLCRLRDALDHPLAPARRLLPVHECNARLARSVGFLAPRLQAVLDRLDRERGPEQLTLLDG